MLRLIRARLKLYRRLSPFSHRKEREKKNSRCGNRTETGKNRRSWRTISKSVSSRTDIGTFRAAIFFTRNFQSRWPRIANRRTLPFLASRRHPRKRLNGLGSPHIFCVCARIFPISRRNKRLSARRDRRGLRFTLFTGCIREPRVWYSDTIL